MFVAFTLNSQLSTKMTSIISIRNTSPRTAVIDIEGVIGVEACYEKLGQTIEQIRRLDTRRVVVNIRSAGGQVSDALLIHDALASLKATIVTRCYGYIASAATIIAQAASPGRREISANALYLVHNATSQVEGNAHSLAQTIELLDKTDQRIAAIYAARSGRPEADFLDLMACNEGNGRWLSPQEAIQAGLADKIIAAALSNEAHEQIRQLLDDIRGGLQERTQQSSEQVAELQNKLALLEARSAKLAALPTRTLPCEDPSLDENILSANQSAYAEDARNFQ